MVVPSMERDAQRSSQPAGWCCLKGMPVPSISCRRRFLAVALVFLMMGLPLVLRLSNYDYARHLRAARALADRAERTAAVEACQEAARLRPRSPEPYLELARIYLSSGRRGEALDAVREAELVGADPVDVEAQRLAVFVESAELATREKVEDWQAAVGHGERLLELGADQREILMLLARAYLALREWGAAESICEQVLLSDPGDEAAAFCLGLLRLREDRVSSSRGYVSETDLGPQIVEAFEAAVAKDGAAHAHAVVGRMLIEHQEWALAAAPS